MLASRVHEPTLRVRSTPADPPLLVQDLLRARGDSDAIALRSADTAMSFRLFYDASLHCAAALRAAGVRYQDRVAIHLPKGIEECWSVFGACEAGGVFVPINPTLKPAQVRHILADSGARALITDRALHASLAAELSTLAEPPAVLFADTLAADAHLGTACTGSSAVDAGEPATIGEDLAAILYTSGSTGAPKGVMVTHANLLAGARIVSRYLRIEASDRLLGVLPLSFDYGLNQLLTTVAQGAELVPFTFRFGNELVGALTRFSITGLAGVPTLWAILTSAAPLLRQTPPRHLRYVTNSGGAVPRGVVDKLRSMLPHTRIYLMYGLTEAFRSTYLDPDEIDRRPDSIGKAIPECEVFVIRSDGRRAAPGEVGLLVHRGPTVSRGYWGRPEDTARVLRPNPLRPADRGADLVCFSGDLARMDADGFLYFVGRNDAMIKSAGFRISPTEIEEVIMATGLFSQVAVIGLPDALIGQSVHAVAVRAGSDAGGPTDDDARLRALQHCALSLPTHMVPRRLEIVDRLPVSGNGKVDYNALRADRLSS
ncbi:MAG: AMP-binding protein [Burkholderiaceae bacterium]